MNKFEKQLRTASVSILMKIIYSASFVFIGWVFCTFAIPGVFNQKLVNHDSILIIITICFVLGLGTHTIVEYIDRTEEKILEKLPHK